MNSKRELGQDARFLPVGEDGRPTAVKVYAIRADGHIARIGLHDGDAILSINGRRISDHSFGVIRALYLEHRLTIRIRRDGEQRVLDWQAEAG